LSAALASCTNADFDEDSQAKGGDSSKSERVNGSISVQAGQQHEDVSTVNGSINIDDNAVLADAETVNGSISVGAGATAKSLETVNGSITLGSRTKVQEDVSTVNGKLTLEQDADVGGDLENVNGRIRIVSAHVGGDINTTSGDIEIGANSKVDGGIHVERESIGPVVFGKRRAPRVVIYPGAVVKGTLKFDREVELYVSDRAQIGPVQGATPMKFSGDQPPAG
jgi:DUF4097 and DUF4098 domain-containing protein YvlB